MDHLLPLVNDSDRLRAALAENGDACALVLRKDRDGNTLLMHAIKTRNLASMRVLLAYASQRQIGRKNVLNTAIWQSDASVVALLMEHASAQQLEQRRGRKNTCLLMLGVHCACRSSQTGCDMLRAMLRQLAHQVVLEDSDGRTALTIAARAGNNAVLELLLPHVPPADTAPLDKALQCIANLNKAPLTEGHKLCGSMLFARGASLGAPNADLQAALRNLVCNAMVPEVAQRALLDPITQLALRVRSHAEPSPASEATEATEATEASEGDGEERPAKRARVAEE